MNKVLRREQTAFRVSPAHKRLISDKEFLFERQDGLIINDKLLKLDRLPEIRFQLQTLYRPGVHC